MKITKPKIFLVMAILLAAVCITALVSATITITSPSTTLNPTAQPTLSAPSSSLGLTPLIGDTDTLTTTLSSGQSGVTVTFLSNGVSIGTATTNGAGTASLSWLVPSGQQAITTQVTLP